MDPRATMGKDADIRGVGLLASDIVSVYVSPCSDLQESSSVARGGLMESCTCHRHCGEPPLPGVGLTQGCLTQGREWA